MKHSLVCLVMIALVAQAAPLLAINPGTEIFVPAAARGAGSDGSTWVTDLYLFNPGVTTVSADLYWLPRDMDNSGVSPVSFTLAGGETLVLEDLILDTFGLDNGTGAVRVVATGSLAVNSRIYNLAGSATFGQGFEGVPATAALGAGAATDVVGLAENSTFRTNIFAVNSGASAATIQLELRDANGTTLASKSYELQPYAAFYRHITDLGVGSFDSGTLHAEVTAGSAIVVGSKVDNTSGDPTTLEAWWQGGAATDGTYYLAIYDSLGYATGGSLSVENGSATLLDTTYTNWDKVDAGGDPECTWIFIASGAFDPPYTSDELASGITFSTTYTDPDGTMEWTFTLAPGQGAGLTGTVEATGSGFSGEAAGCNGEFPVQTIMGGFRP